MRTLWRQSRDCISRGQLETGGRRKGARASGTRLESEASNQLCMVVIMITSVYKVDDIKSGKVDETYNPNHMLLQDPNLRT